jgi:hypothetical protein
MRDVLTRLEGDVQQYMYFSKFIDRLFHLHHWAETLGMRKDSKEISTELIAKHIIQIYSCNE